MPLHFTCRAFFLAYYIFVPLKIKRNGIVVATGYKALRTIEGAFLTRRLGERPVCDARLIGAAKLQAAIWRAS
jgi:hypothetical protein